MFTESKRVLKQRRAVKQIFLYHLKYQRFTMWLSVLHMGLKCLSIVCVKCMQALDEKYVKCTRLNL